MIENFEDVFIAEIVSNNLQSFYMFDEHYSEVYDAKIDISGLVKIGWFRKKIELVHKEV